MICKVCGSEFSAENFDVCPYCMTPATVWNEKVENVIAEEEILSEPLDEENVHPNNADNLRQTSDDSKIEKSQLYMDVLSALEEDSEITEADLFEEKEEPIDIPIDMLGLSVRAVNAFRRVNIHTLNQLVEFLAVNGFSNIRNVGAKTIQETEELLRRFNAGEMFFQGSQKIDTPSLYLFNDMSPDADYLSVGALTEFGFTPNAISKLVNEGIKCCSELRHFTTAELKRILGVNYETTIIELAKYLEKDIIDLTSYVLDNLREGRAFEVFLRRAKGETLQEIANNPYNGEEKITRERVRQMESNFFRRIRPFVRELLYLCLSGEKIITTHDLLDIFDVDEYDQILLYACKLIEDFEYLDFADGVVKKKEITVNEILSSIIRDVIKDGANLIEVQTHIEEALYKNNIDYISIDALKNWLNQNGYSVYGDFVTKGKGGYTLICRDILRKHFPKGIKLSHNAQEQATDLIKLRAIAKEQYGGIEMPEKDKALSAIISRSGVVLCGRGTYILDENVIVDESILLNIKDFIDKCEYERVFYHEIYAAFEGVLNMVCGIDNYNYLHGVLVLRFPNEYEYSRDYLLKNGVSDGEAESIADRIYSFICRNGKPVSKAELEQHFMGFSNVMITMPFATDSRLFQWEYNYFSCTGLLSFSDEHIQKIKDTIELIFNENMGYASDAILFDVLSEKCPEFIIANDIKNEMNLHYTLSVLLGDEYDFHRPHISKKNCIDISSTKNVAMYLMGNPMSFTYEEYVTMITKMGWSAVTAGCVLSDLENDFSRISVGTYLRNSELVIPSDTVKQIEDLICNEMQDGILSLSAIDFKKYPEWSYEWNTFALETVLKNRSTKFTIIHPVMKDRRYQRGIIVEKDCGLCSYSQVISHKMKSLGYEKLSESQFLSFLVVNSLALKAIPNELNNSDFLRKDNGYYYVV